MGRLQFYFRFCLFTLLFFNQSSKVFCSDIFIQCTESSLEDLKMQSVQSEKSPSKGYAWIDTFKLNRLQLAGIKNNPKFCMSNIWIAGQIINGDSSQLRKILDLMSEYGALVSLSSPGGDAYEAMKMGRLLAEHDHISTSVNQNDVCASACVLLFAGGNIKSVTYDTPTGVGGKLAIHRVSFINKEIANLKQDEFRKLYDKGMDDIKIYFKEMGIRSDLADEMMRYSSDDAHVLTTMEIKYYGLDQMNPYKYEQDKAQWIARCGQEWWKLKQTLDKTADDKCDLRNFVIVENDKNIIDSKKYMECRGSILGPLYKMCGLDWPKWE